MQLKCDRCECNTSNPLVDEDENGLPIILCQRCFARKRAIKIYEKQPKATGSKYPVKPKTLIKDNRYATLYTIKRKNGYKVRVDLYEDCERKHTYFYCDPPSATLRARTWLNHKKFKKDWYCGIKRRPSRKVQHNKARYITKYNREHYRLLALRFNRVQDEELLIELDSAKSKPDLIREMYEVWKKCKS